MSKEARSSFVLQGFEPSTVRLKRKLRLILNKNLRKDKTSDANVSLNEFILYAAFLLLVTTICVINHISQDVLNADRCIRRLLITKLQLDTVTDIDAFWEYMYRFNEEFYSNVAPWKTLTNNSKEQVNYQILLSKENFILGIPRLRQIRVDHTYCQIIQDLSVKPISCYAPYHKSKEYQSKFTTVTGTQYEYTSSTMTDALTLSNVYGPYDKGGYIQNFRSTKDLNYKAIENLKRTAWIDLSTRAIFIEFIYFNPNTELLTSINILFEFLTTGTVQVQDFFYTISLNSFFFGRNKSLGIFQIIFILCYITFGFYYVGKIAEHRLWFIMSSYWNVYDLGLLILFTISFYLDIKFLMYISQVFKCLSVSKLDIFKDLSHFIQIQINRTHMEAYITAAVLIRLLRYLPHFSNIIANLINVFYKSIKNSLGFLFLFFLVFISFVISATFHYGDELYEFHTFALTSYTLIRCTLGQFEYDRAYRVSPIWTPIFYMIYVCVIFFVLLNLLVAVVNETYVLGKMEQKQIENDLQEEYIHESNYKRLNTFHRSKKPILQIAIIQQINRLMNLFSKQSVDFNDRMDINTDSYDDDISLDAKQTIVIDKLQNILLDNGYNKNVIDKFVQRLSLSQENDDDMFLFEMEENKSVKILYDEFKIFNNQYEKLAQDWQKTATAARETILINAVDHEQSLPMGPHLDILEKRLKKFEHLMSKTLENIVELYINRFSMN